MCQCDPDQGLARSPSQSANACLLAHVGKPCWQFMPHPDQACGPNDALLVGSRKKSVQLHHPHVSFTALVEQQDRGSASKHARPTFASLVGIVGEACSMQAVSAPLSASSELLSLV